MKMHSNKLSKIISILISVSMLVSINITTTAFAEDRIYADPETFSYMPGTSSDAGNHMIYMQDSYAKASYGANNFLRDGTMYPTFVAMAWPPTLRTRTQGDGYPEQKATINNANNTITSTKTGITYSLPTLNPSSNETMILDQYGVRSAAYGSLMLANLDINAKYDKISILIGVADANSSSTGQISAFVTYDDKTDTLPEGATKGAYGSMSYYTYPEAIQDSPEADGRNGYLVVSNPRATAAGQSEADNFVADFESYKYKPGTGASSLTSYTSNFEKSTGTQRTVAAFEYTLDVDETKTIKSITFNHNRIKVGGGHYPAGYAVLGLVGQTVSEDWTDKVAKINEDIAALSAEGAQITSSAILSTLTAINEAKRVGVGEYINIDDFNALLTDELVNDLFEDTNINTMSWDYEEEFFGILDSIYYAVENTTNNVSSETKEWMTEAYESLLDSLINADGKTADEIKERFELLKNTSSMELQNTFNQKIIYESGNLSIGSEHEFVTLEIDFSQPISESQLTTNNFVVKRGDEKVNPKWISFEKKMTGSDITGVKVKVRNSQDYASDYTLFIDRAMRGANGGKWAYQFENSLNTQAPIVAKTTDVAISSENVISGKVVLESSMDESQSYVVLISSYDEKGMNLGTISITGTVSAGASANAEIAETTLPAGTSNVICYAMDSFANMTLLAPPITLK